MTLLIDSCETQFYSYANKLSHGHVAYVIVQMAVLIALWRNFGQLLAEESLWEYIIFLSKTIVILECFPFLYGKKQPWLLLPARTYPKEIA